MGAARVGICTGLRREAACFRRDDAFPLYRVRSGAGPDAAARAARDLVAEGCGALVSFGFAGALSPAVPAGALLIPETVVTLDDERFETNERWRRHVLAAEPEALTAPLIGVDAVAGSPAAKAALAARSGAIAVDTESHAVGRVARDSGRPFLVVRAVSDGARDPLPGWLLACLDAERDVDVAAFAAALLRDPRRLAIVWTLFRGSRKALARLRPLALADGPLFHLKL